jgi:hypothetical protein
LPLIENNEWFFDTEMLLLAEHNNLRIYEVPVEWIEDLDTRVKIVKTATEDIRGLVRVRKSFFKGGGFLAPATLPVTREVVEKDVSAVK